MNTLNVIFWAFMLAQGNTSKNDYNLVGVWQNAPNIASGWSETYQFFSDSTFVFNSSQMECDNRLLSYSGTWTFSPPYTLTLSINSHTIIVGGELVEATGSCGSEFEIIDGIIKTESLQKTEIKSIKLSDFYIDTDNLDLQTLMFDKVRYWKMNSDPNAYEW